MTEMSLWTNIGNRPNVFAKETVRHIQFTRPRGRPCKGLMDLSVRNDLLVSLTPKKLPKAILFVTIILVFSKMGNILTIRIIGEQLTIPMLVPDGWYLEWIKLFMECV